MYDKERETRDGDGVKMERRRQDTRGDVGRKQEAFCRSRGRLSKVEFQKAADQDVEGSVCFCFANNGIPMHKE